MLAESGIREEGPSQHGQAMISAKTRNDDPDGPEIDRMHGIFLLVLQSWKPEACIYFSREQLCLTRPHMNCGL